MTSPPTPVPAADAAAPASAETAPARLSGLSGKLLMLTIVFVMLAEVFVFVPSIANFRANWLRDRLLVADVAAIALDSATEIARDTQDELLARTGAITIAVRQDGKRKLVAMKEMPPEITRVVDIPAMTPTMAIAAAFETLLAGDGRILLVKGPVDEAGQRVIEVVLAEDALRKALFLYSRNILVLSFVISIIAAILVYLSLRWLIVRPLQRLRESMRRFSANPEDPGLIIRPSGRNDEIGDAEARFAAMQSELADMLGQKRHLADLGLGVSKINHDLRNILASAQLFTERLTLVPDATVQRLAPKLIASLDRALGYSQAVLAYGKAREAPPQRRLVALARLVDDVAGLLNLAAHPAISFEALVPATMEVDADPDQLFRVLLNLARNAVQAMESEADASLIRRLSIRAERRGSVVDIVVADTGPGLPARAREHLFKAFQGSTRPGGTGLGLAIAAELVRAHGGSIELVDLGAGAVFRVQIPDRPVDLEAARRAARK